MVDLITQISSKRTDDGEKVGKFGTGFISTHLISEIVTIKGVYHRTKESLDYKHLELIIDRSGKTDAQIKESLIKAIDDIESIDSSQSIEWSYEKDVPTTSFVYDLTNNYSNDVKDAIKSGSHDLNEAIPFVFAFSQKIKEITLTK